MAVRFDGKKIFGDGPQRVSVHPIGQELLQRFRMLPNAPGMQPNGTLDFAVVVKGRLVYDDEESLWTRRELIAEELTDPPAAKQFEDGVGRDYGEMRFVTFTAGDRTDRGRKVTLAFEALFVAFAHWP